MSRYLIIDTSTITNQQIYESMMIDLDGHYVNILDEEQSMVLFNKIFEAGRDHQYATEYYMDYSKSSWQEYSKTL